MKIEHNQLIDVYVGSPTPDAIECRSVIPTWAPIFEGHFPENPILPGALMVEIMAQAGSFIYMLKSNFAGMAYLAAVKSAKFRAHARAGESLLIKARATQSDERFMACEATVEGTDGRALASAALTLRLEPFVSDRMRDAFVKLLSAGHPGPLRQAPCVEDSAILKVPRICMPPASQTKEFIA